MRELYDGFDESGIMMYWKMITAAQCVYGYDLDEEEWRELIGEGR